MPCCKHQEFQPGLSQHANDHAALRSNEDDEELLIHVPFDGSVKLKAICLIGAAQRSDLATHSRWPVQPWVHT